MDVDCDGVNEKCEVTCPHTFYLPCTRPSDTVGNQGNQDGQPQTNWGHLAAYAVPYIVIPDRFLTSNKEILPGNNVAAVIWYVCPVQVTIIS
jgi:chitosanase